MAPRRLPRGTRKDPVSLGYAVERENKQRWEQIAKNCGVSSAALFDVMVETVELDAHGRPVWFPDTEGLPIDAP
ncbi:hypothetical protein GCM10027414_36990 [Humibacter ginsengiterrae]